MYFIKEMPIFERPREKLINEGVEILSNTELLAIILRTGSRDKSVIELAKDVLYRLENISDLKKLTLEELLKVNGIKVAKATSIIAAIELGKRLEKASYHTEVIESAKDIYYKMKFLENENQENFYCMFLNTRLAIIKYELIYKGTVDQMVIHPRDIFIKAIKANASYIILVHNHPTGNANPSKADKTTTKALTEVSEIINIEILDHIIIGKNQFYSFKEAKIFNL